MRHLQDQREQEEANRSICRRGEMLLQERNSRELEERLRRDATRRLLGGEGSFPRPEGGFQETLKEEDRETVLKVSLS